MKTINPLRYIKAIMAIVAFILILNSCKKNIDLPPSVKISGTSDLERAKAYAQERVKQLGGIPFVFPVNKKMEVEWRDKNGVPKDPKVTINSDGGGCTNYDLPDFTTLVQYQRIYDCDLANSQNNPGYYIQFEYNVSWSKTVVLTNANSVSTTGWISIVSDANSSTVWSTGVTGSGDVAITDLGVDPNNSSNHIYNVRFDYGKTNHSSYAIPTAYINGDISGTYTVKLGATFASNCPDDYALWITPASWFGFTGNTGEHPCDRNDYPIFQPPSIFTNHDRIGISGYDPLYSCSGFGGSFIRTDLQQVAYSLDGGANWNLFSNVLGGGSTTNPILQYGYIRYLDFAESVVLTPGTYTVILRFRNWKYSSVPNPLTIPTTANGDCHSPGDDPTSPSTYSTYAYEYWPGIVIQ